MFESIAKTNTTNTRECAALCTCEFESIAKTNTTNTILEWRCRRVCLRVLLKQIQQTQDSASEAGTSV